jgi:phospholipid/cholesterol/gamma-HCH transport system permease protein
VDLVVRYGYEPLRAFIETIGAMVVLLRRTVAAALRPPYDYGPELVDQFLFALRLGWFPMIVASTCWARSIAWVGSS